MGLAAPQPRFTAADYLAWEAEQPERHDFLGGEVFAMACDRGLKFSHYRSLPSLEEYVLVDLDTRTTDCYRKGADGLWVLHPFANGAMVSLTDQRSAGHHGAAVVCGSA